MPTERFYRLPEQKKQVIREAAMKEFARVPFEKASINQIIHNADISRGSFYTYFEDKQDVVEFLFEDSYNQMKELCAQELSDSGGDYFAMISRMFEFFVEKLQDTKSMIDMVRNIFSYQENAKILGLGGFPNMAPGIPDPECGDDSLQWVYDRVDKSRYRYQDIAHFKVLLIMGMTALMFALKQFYEYPELIGEVRDSLNKSLELLKYGTYQN